MTKTHKASMNQAKSDREFEVQRIVGQWQAEVAQMDAQNQAEMKAQDARHREEISRIVTEGQERLTSSDAEVEPLRAKLAEAHDRLRSERHRHKEELTRLEIELKSSIHRAEERLRDAEERLSEAREELAGSRQQELKPSGKRQLPGRDLSRLLPKRPIQTALLAKLWVEHALDRDDQ